MKLSEILVPMSQQKTLRNQNILLKEKLISTRSEPTPHCTCSDHWSLSHGARSVLTTASLFHRLLRLAAATMTIAAKTAQHRQLHPMVPLAGR